MTQTAGFLLFEILNYTQKFYQSNITLLTKFLLFCTYGVSRWLLLSTAYWGTGKVVDSEGASRR